MTHLNKKTFFERIQEILNNEKFSEHDIIEELNKINKKELIEYIVYFTPAKINHDFTDYSEYDKYVADNKGFEESIMGYDQWKDEKNNL